MHVALSVRNAVLSRMAAVFLGYKGVCALEEKGEGQE